MKVVKTGWVVNEKRERISPFVYTSTILNPDGSPISDNILGMIPLVQKGTPDGVATLTAEGRLTPGQAPTLFEVGGSNPGLSINSRWDDINGIIDQKKGYYVPAGKTYYTDTAVSVVGGTLADDTTAIYVNGTYGTVTVSGATRYVKFADMARGYVLWATSYGVDLCKGSNITTRLYNDYIKVTSRPGAWHKRVMLANERTLKAGQTYTLSILARVNAAVSAALRPCSLAYSTIPVVSPIYLSPTTDFTVIKNTFIPTQDVVGFYSEVLVQNAVNDLLDIDIKGWKLEEGTQSTIARQEANGVWQLIDPPPDPTTELMECRSNQFMVSSGITGNYLAGGITSGALSAVTTIYLPTPLRIKPVARIINPVTVTIRTITGYSPLATYESPGTPIDIDTTAYDAVSGAVQLSIKFPTAIGTNNTPCSIEIRSGKLLLDANL